MLSYFKLNTAILLVTLFHFSGFDRFAVAFIETYLSVDWVWQFYVVMIFGLIGFSQFNINLISFILFLINLAILPFNNISAFINRVNAGYWFAFFGSISVREKIESAIFIGATVGSALILIDGVMIASIREPKSLVGTGLFVNPSFGLTTCFAIMLLRYKKIVNLHLLFGSLLLTSAIVGGARVTIALTLVLIINYFRLKSILIFLITAIFFSLIYLLPYSSNLVSVNKIRSSYSEISSAAMHVLSSQRERESHGASEVRPTNDVSEVRPTSASERLAGLYSLHGAMPQLFFPLRAGIKPDEVGHIGLILYLSTYGLIILICVAVISLFILPAREFLVLFTLLFFFTDPILIFGLSLALLRLADPHAPTFKYGKLGNWNSGKRENPEIAIVR